MIFVLDNYDSFTYNLVQRLGEIDPAVRIEVRRNDQVTLAEIEAFAPARIIISPGPCTPALPHPHWNYGQKWSDVVKRR